MPVTGYDRPGGRIMKLKVVSPFGFSVGAKSVFQGDVFEADEYLGKMFIHQGRCVEVKDEPAPAPEPEASEPEDDEGDEEKPTKRGKKK